MSLVADYGTDSDSDGAEDASDTRSKVQSVSEETEDGSRGKNYLISRDDDVASSEDEANEDKSSAVDNKERLPNPMAEKLPTPQISSTPGASSKTLDGPGSVFANPFENAEIAKQSILEKHVKMTEAMLLTGKKAKVCKAFKQGRCRFGKHCQYSHDLDANLSARYKQDETAAESSPATTESNNQSRIPKHLRLPPPPQQQGFMGTVNTLHSGPKHVSTHQQRVHYLQQQKHMHTADADDDDDKFNVGDKRKKRAGMAQTLIPPKRAMSSLNKQRESERPWTVRNQHS